MSSINVYRNLLLNYIMNIEHCTENNIVLGLDIQLDYEPLTEHYIMNIQHNIAENNIF